MAKLTGSHTLVWNALRQDHLIGFLFRLTDGSPGIQDYSIKKTLRMACGDMIGVECVSSFRDRQTGEWVDERGAEFWWTKEDRVAGWRAYMATERSDPAALAPVALTG